MTGRGEPRAAPLVALALAAMTAPLAPGTGAAAPAQTVTVRLVDDRFIPDHLRFRRGETYRLVLENHGHELHEFSAPQFMKAIAIADPQVLAAGGNEVVLQPGETKELSFTARDPGHYGLTCADHDWDGMTGDITVE